MSSRAQRPAAQKGIEHILEANHSCPLALLAERLQIGGALLDPQVSADIWLFRNRGGGKWLWLSHLLSWNVGKRAVSKIVVTLCITVVMQNFRLVNWALACTKREIKSSILAEYSPHEKYSKYKSCCLLPLSKGKSVNRLCAVLGLERLLSGIYLCQINWCSLKSGTHWFICMEMDNPLWGQSSFLKQAC